MAKLLGRKPVPLKPEEVGPEVAAYCDFDSQRLEYKNGSGRTVIDRVCSVCDKKYTSSVVQMRGDIRRGRRMTTFCAECSKKPGEHLVGLRNKRGVNGYINTHGYRLLYRPDHPTATKTGHVLEHRYVMETILGRPLSADETVHHINGIRSDNRPENLQLRKGKHGNGQVWSCGDCGSHNIIASELK